MGQSKSFRHKKSTDGVNVQEFTEESSTVRSRLKLYTGGVSVDNKRSNLIDKNLGQGKGRFRAYLSGGTRGLQGLRHRKKTSVDFFC